MAKLPNGKRLPGKLFVVEGIGGSGKSTQLDLLRKWLIGTGYCVAFSEWNSSPVVRATTRRGRKKKLLSPTTFSLIHAADFADRMERQMLPALKAGAIVLADRYMYTAFARDVVRGVDPEWVRGIYAFAIQPTIAFYFRAPLEESTHRIMLGRPKIKYYEAGMDLGLSPNRLESFGLLQKKIAREYEKMVDEYGLIPVDATLPLTKQQQIVRNTVAPHLKGVLRAERSAWRDVLAKEELYGRYLPGIGAERGNK